MSRHFEEGSGYGPGRDLGLQVNMGDQEEQGQDLLHKRHPAIPGEPSLRMCFSRSGHYTRQMNMWSVGEPVPSCCFWFPLTTLLKVIVI